MKKCKGCPFCHDNTYYSYCFHKRKDRDWEMTLTYKDIEIERTVSCPLEEKQNDQTKST